MKRQHRQQHRSKRQSQEALMKAQLQEQRTQNQKLRRENARLRREVEKLQALVYVEDELAPEPLPVPEPPKSLCEACGSDNLKKFSTPGRTLTICGACHHRKASIVVTTD